MPDQPSSDAPTGTQTSGNNVTTSDVTLQTGDASQQGTAPAAPGLTQNPLAVKLEGEGVPEKFQGKTLADVLKSYGEAEAAMLHAKTETGQWRQFADQLLAKQGQPQQQQQQQPTYNPLDDLDERSVKAVSHIAQNTVKDAVDNVLAPIAEGVAAMQLEFVKATRPDFPDLEARAKEYYATMPLQARMNPAYGWDFAYRLAKAEAMGKPSLIPQTPAPPVGGPTTGAAPGPAPPQYDKDQIRYMEIVGMTPEQYEKYRKPQDIVGAQLAKDQRRFR